MNNSSKFLLFSLLFLFGIVSVDAQTSCCATASKAKTECAPAGTADQTTGDTKTALETTSGCTPSSCRGAKTKFGEAKVISDLRENLIALKSKMENYEEHEFSNQAITVHGIVGETDDESLDILTSHLAIIETEIYGLVEQQIPNIEAAKNKAVQVKQLGERISTLSQFL